MRILLGWLVLLLAFAAAALHQQRFADGMREEREERLAARRPVEQTDLALTGRATLLIGRPSGAAPIELPEPEPEPATSAAPAPALRDEAPPPDWTPPVFSMTVAPGQVLGLICQEVYGTSRAPIPELVAEYNGLSSPDALRAGQRLELPPLEVLRAGR